MKRELHIPGLALFAASVGASALMMHITEGGESVVRAGVSDLLDSPDRFHDRMVEVVGRLRPSDGRDHSDKIHRLTVTNGHRSVRLALPLGRTDDLRPLEGEPVRVTGVFWDLILLARPGFYWGCSDLRGGCFVPRDPRLALYSPGLLRLPGSDCFPCDLES